MRIRFTVTALREIDEICTYIGQDNPNAAAAVANAIQRTVDWICKHPDAAPIALENVRAKLVGRYQYRIFYTIESGELVIRNVRSTKRLKPWEQI